MTEFNSTIERECRTFTHYLLGCEPHSYAVRKYAEAHCVSPVFSAGTRFDDFLLKAARSHWLLAKLADSYARVAAPGALLRKKLVLLLAILETSPPSYQMLDAVQSGGRLALFLRLAGRGSASILSLTAGSLVFLPAQLLLKEGSRKQS